MALKDVQAKLDGIEKRLVENKKARLKLKEEAKELRDQYYEAEAEREELLKQELGEDD